MAPNETDLLESVLDTTGTLISGVKPDQLHQPTPCADLDVNGIVDHLVGWASSFAARLTGGEFEGEPNEYHAGVDPADEFRRAASSIVGAYRAGGGEAGKLPIGVLLMEFLTHGWDLARATGQQADFSTEAAQQALAAGQAMLKPEYRGPDKSFGPEVEVPGSADPIDKVVAFLGRNPAWHNEG